jgi:hypothetical protein
VRIIFELFSSADLEHLENPLTQEDYMATYSQIIEYVEKEFGTRIHHGCWIAHCKELAGIPVSRSTNRQGDRRVVPCPIHHRSKIFAAFRHFGMLT